MKLTTAMPKNRETRVATKVELMSTREDLQLGSEGVGEVAVREVFEDMVGVWARIGDEV